MTLMPKRGAATSRLKSKRGIPACVRAPATTIPKEWTDIWETEGYTKFWVIYSADGSGLE